MSVDDLGELLGVSRDGYELLLKSAIDAYSADRLLHAHVILAGLMTLRPADARPYKLMGSLLLLGGRRREAAAVYERARQLEPDDLYTLVALGEIRLHALQLPEAIVLFRRMFEIDPDAHHAATRRARYLVADSLAKLGGNAP